MDNWSIYRAYDIRGVYPEDINESVIFRISSALNKKFFKKGEVVVAYDARTSSPSLQKEVIRGLRGRSVINVGSATTPMFYFFIISRRAAGGIMVTASHNPKQWNGLKIAGPMARPVDGRDIKRIVDSSIDATEVKKS